MQLRLNMKLMLQMFVVMLFCCVSANAQIQKGTQILSLGLGAGIPLTNVDLTTVGGEEEKIGKTGLALGGQYLYHLTPNVGIGAEVAYSGFGDKEHTLPVAIVTTGGNVLTFQGVARYVFAPESRIYPYLIGGLGLNKFSAHLKARPGPGYLWVDTGTTETRTLSDESSTGVAFSLGVGLEGAFTDTVLGGLEVRWVYAGVDEDKFGDSSGRALSIMGRIGWKFGG